MEMLFYYSWPIWLGILDRVCSFQFLISFTWLALFVVWLCGSSWLKGLILSWYCSLLCVCLLHYRWQSKSSTRHSWILAAYRRWVCVCVCVVYLCVCVVYVCVWVCVWCMCECVCECVWCTCVCVCGVLVCVCVRVCVSVCGVFVILCVCVK